jgi:hypothetical protein
MVTANVDGAVTQVRVDGASGVATLTDDDRRLLLSLLVRRASTVRGLRVNDLPGQRLGVSEDEITSAVATMDTYDYYAPGAAALTITNVGTAYRNILTTPAASLPVYIDFTGKTQCALVVSANFAGAGAYGFRIVRDTDNAVIWENANIGVLGERTQLLPFTNILLAGLTGVVATRVLIKSTTAADDPIIRRVSGLTL